MPLTLLGFVRKWNASLRTERSIEHADAIMRHDADGKPKSRFPSGMTNK